MVARSRVYRGGERGGEAYTASGEGKAKRGKSQ